MFTKYFGPHLNYQFHGHSFKVVCFCFTKIVSIGNRNFVSKKTINLETYQAFINTFGPGFPTNFRRRFVAEFFSIFIRRVVLNSTYGEVAVFVY